MANKCGERVRLAMSVVEPRGGSPVRRNPAMGTWCPAGSRGWMCLNGRKPHVKSLGGNNGFSWEAVWLERKKDRPGSWTKVDRKNTVLPCW